MGQVETVAIKSSGSTIVENRLIGDFDIEDRLQDSRGFPGRDGEGDIESEDKTEDILGVMDFCEIDDRFCGGRMHKFLRFIMILPVLVAELELRGSFLLQNSFRGVGLGNCLDAMLTVIVTTLIDRDLFPTLPAEESMAAIGEEVFCLIVFTESLIELEEKAADLAFELRFLLAVVEVEIFVRGVTDRANYLFRYRW